MEPIDDRRLGDTGNDGGWRRPDLVWRIVIVFVAAMVIWLLVSQLTRVVFGPDYSRVGHIVLAVGASMLALPTVVLARRYLDRRPWAGLRLTGPRDGWRQLVLGMVCYLIPAGLGLAAAVWACIGFHLAFQTTQQIFGGDWGVLSATDGQLLEQVAFGLIPLSCAVLVLRVAHRGRVNWRAVEPDLV